MIGERLRQTKFDAERILRRAQNVVGCDLREAARILAAQLLVRQRSGVCGKALLAGDRLDRIVEARPRARRILRDEPAANRERLQRDDLALVDQGELGRAAADIDVKDAVLALLRQRDGAGAVGGEETFQLVAGGGADELAGFRREDFVDGARVRLLDGLAGEDDGAAVDFVLLDAGFPVGAGDELAELAGVDRAVREGRA